MPDGPQTPQKSDQSEAQTGLGGGSVWRYHCTKRTGSPPMHAVEDSNFIHTLPDDILASIYAEIAYVSRSYEPAMTNID